MKRTQLQQLLDRIGVLGHSCDLDLLLFFHRHPRTLLTIEQLAAYVGYDVQQTSRSLNVLIGAGLLRRSQHPGHSTRMYLLTTGGPRGAWLQSLLRVAATRDGRRGVMRALEQRKSAGHPGADSVEPGRAGGAGSAGEEKGIGDRYA